MPLATPLNNASSTLASDRTVLDGVLVLKTGAGALFGDPTPEAPIRITVADRSTLVGGQIVAGTVKTIYLCTERNGDTLGGLTAIEGTTDQGFSRNDPVASLITAGTIQEIQDLASSGGNPDAVLTTNEYDDPDWLTGLAPEKVTGLPADLAAKADDAAVVKKAANLADLSSAATARTNLGLGDAAIKSTGTDSQSKFPAATVNCYGDSLTNGGSSGTPDGTYPAQLSVLANRYCNNQGVSGETAAQILTRVQAASSVAKADQAWIFCAGRNDLGGVSTTAEVLARMAAMVAELGVNDKYVVMGIINAEGEGSNATGAGLANYNQVIAINAGLASAYGSRFFDARAALLAYPPQNAQDIADIAVGVPPTSLRAGGDSLHLNATGYGLWASGLWPAYAAILNGPDPVVTAANLPAVFQSMLSLLGISAPTAGAILGVDYAGSGRAIQFPLVFNGQTLSGPGVNFYLTPTTGLGIQVFGTVLGADLQSGESYLGNNAWVNTLGQPRTRENGQAILLRFGFTGFHIHCRDASSLAGDYMPVSLSVALDGSIQLPVLADSAVAPPGEGFGAIYFGSDHLDGGSLPQLCRKNGAAVTVVG